ncbi:hypothetical protein [Blautia intestinalis]|nr:hypothetical protein [Blautia intestinalis]
MLGERVKKLTKLMLTGLTMALCVVAFSPTVKAEAAMLQESEPNDNPAQANQLPLNTWVKGKMDDEYDYDVDWYQFTIPKRGVSQIEMIPDSTNTSGAGWEVSVQDVNRHEMLQISGRTAESYKLGLAPGKYYMKVSGIHQTFVDNTHPYNLRINYSESEEWEIEQYYENKNFSNANNILPNKKYTGNMYSERDVDYYRVKINGKQQTTVTFSIDDTVSSPGRWMVELIEYNTRKSLGFYTTSENLTRTVQCNGDLIIKVSTGLWWYAEGDIYHVQAAVKNANKTTTPVKATVKKPSATKITSIKAGKRKATIRWKKASKATGYYVYRATSPRGKYKKVATVTGKTSYTDKKSLKRKKNYYYKVVSIRKSGSKVVKAKASAYKRVKIK